MQYETKTHKIHTDNTPTGRGGGVNLNAQFSQLCCSTLTPDRNNHIELKHTFKSINYVYVRHSERILSTTANRATAPLRSCERSCATTASDRPGSPRSCTVSPGHGWLDAEPSPTTSIWVSALMVRKQTLSSANLSQWSKSQRYKEL